VLKDTEHCPVQSGERKVKKAEKPHGPKLGFDKQADEKKKVLSLRSEVMSDGASGRPLQKKRRLSWVRKGTQEREYASKKGRQ